MPSNIVVEVVYATPAEQKIVSVTIPEGSTIKNAIELTQIYPQLNAQTPVGIFGKIRSLEHVLQAGDRIEIYSPLLIDPKQARRDRAKRDKLAKLREKQQRKKLDK